LETCEFANEFDEFAYIISALASEVNACNVKPHERPPIKHTSVWTPLDEWHSTNTKSRFPFGKRYVGEYVGGNTTSATRADKFARRVQCGDPKPQDVAQWVLDNARREYERVWAHIMHQGEWQKAPDIKPTTTLAFLQQQHYDAPLLGDTRLNEQVFVDCRAGR